MTEPFAARHYASRAEDYISSVVHNQGNDLNQIERLVAGKELQRALDLGCGGGHVSYRLAPHVSEIVACDPTGPMLEAVAQEATRLRLTNIKTMQAPAEKLPFEDRSFDGVFCRFTTHHWADAVAGLREAKRVMTRDAIGVFIDVTAPSSALLDSWVQSMELLRDVSHVRDYRISEWAALLEQAGFSLQTMETHRLRMDFKSWVSRTKTPSERVAAIRSLQHSAPEEVKRHFCIEPDGSFKIDVSSFQVAPL